MAKKRLDALLVNRKLAANEADALALIMAGEVIVAGKKATKPGNLVDADAEIRLAEKSPYVSRGGLKLAHALDEFKLDVKGLTAVDIGSSTGGFTDCLLQRGAKRVYAVDVGYGQLAWSLRQDARVVVMERQNVRYLEPSQFPEELDLGTCDLSFISLTLVLDPLARVLGPDKPLVVLIKPQFEVGKGRVGKGGVVRDPAERQATVDKVTAFARDHGFAVVGTTESPVVGPAGNVEFLGLLRTPGGAGQTPPR